RGRQLGEELGQHDMAVTLVKRHVRQFTRGAGRPGEIERVNLLTVGRDALQAPPIGRANLDRQPRSTLSEESLECRAVAERHLPGGVGQERNLRVLLNLWSVLRRGHASS